MGHSTMDSSTATYGDRLHSGAETKREEEGCLLTKEAIKVAGGLVKLIEPQHVAPVHGARVFRIRSLAVGCLIHPYLSTTPFTCGQITPQQLELIVYLGSEATQQMNNCSKDLAELLTKIKSLTVRLSGPAGSQFTGSGIVFAGKSNKTYILTATHNIGMALGMIKTEDLINHNKKLKTSNDSLDDFSARVAICADGHNCDVRITKAICLKPPSGQSDLCMLVTNDLGLKEHISKILGCQYSPKRANKSDPKLWTEFWDVLPDNEMYRFEPKKNKVNAGKKEYLKYKYGSCSLLQAGFGRTSAPPKNKEEEKKMFDDASTQIQVRHLSLGASQGIIDSTAEEYVNVLTVISDNDCTTRNGDSGGPMFLHTKDKQDFLVGVTLGSNYFETSNEDKGDDYQIVNNAVTVVNRSHIELFKKALGVSTT